MRVLIKEPGKSLTSGIIGNDLESMQKAVGGLIEVVPMDGKSLVMVANEEGLLLDLPYNFGQFVGTVFFCGVDNDGEFISINEEQVTKVKTLFNRKENSYD